MGAAALGGLGVDYLSRKPSAALFWKSPVPYLHFQFCGQAMGLEVPDGQQYLDCAQQIISQKAYPFPSEPQPGVKCVVDLGAHVGEFTVMAAVRWPQATIYAYEPNPQVIPLLRKNCQPFGNIRIVQKAIDAIPRRAMLRFSPGGSIAAVVPMPDDPQPSTEGIEVEVGSAKEVGLLNPDVLKIDIEGSEVYALAVLQDRLPSIGLIYVEYHNLPSREYIEKALAISHEMTYHNQQSQIQGDLCFVRR